MGACQNHVLQAPQEGMKSFLSDHPTKRGQNESGFYNSNDSKNSNNIVVIMVLIIMIQV